MSDQTKIRILVADDHPVVREGLVAIINSQKDMEVVAEASNGVEAVERYAATRPDVALLDLLMPGKNATEAIHEIVEKFTNARVIVLTTYHGEEHIYRALQAGARAYLLKASPKKELLEAIRKVHSGQRVIPTEVASTLASRIPASDLTPREMDVLRLIVKGLSNKEIASQLHLTEGTVKGYISGLLIKLHVSDRTQAATAAIQRGLVELD